MKRATTRVRKHNLILHGEMSPTHRRESYMRDQEVVLLPNIPIPDIILAIRSMHRSLFLVLPPFLNIGMRFLLREEGCNTPCYRRLNQVT
jgi:hypothetical protein